MDVDTQPSEPTQTLPQLCGFRWQDMTADDLVAILHADGSEPSYADQLPGIHDDHFSFSRHIHNHNTKAMQGQGSGFASPTTASLSPFGLSSESPSSVDDQQQPQPHHIQQLQPGGQHAFPFPPNFPVYGQPSPSPSTSASMPPPPPARPNKRARDEQDQPAAQRKMQHACTHCKKLKMKCTFMPGSERCERCIKKGHPECRVEGRKRNPGPNARELLLRDLKAKDALIAGLLKHIFDPHMGTPLSIAAGRLDPSSLTRTILPPSPPDTEADDERTAPRGMGVQGLMSLLTQASASIARGGAGGGAAAWKLEEESSDSDEDEHEHESSSHTGTSSDEDDDNDHPKSKSKSKFGTKPLRLVAGGVCGKVPDTEGSDEGPSSNVDISNPLVVY
ncbi:hypothetical protein EXIGLDRAFT_751195 [Exidia glandulosa HHB12029]|uniref:Zn(2)-C6 fungal-type domain-containing protein n=1 Tax=Exidia glandulosa HHB12029 TaxID=1314781 RepID=A0A165FQI5_EXIGL|nr:hypothetical protein EXIGLDRAFT_751195 [Exidia glandulosa HHB12029]